MKPILTMLVLLLTVGAALAGPPAKRLNVLLIIADDQNCALGCYGNTVIHTPNLDRLAARGIVFDRAYCNYPICGASRASFLSGMRPETTKVLGNGTSPRIALGPDYPFLPEAFHAGGFFTGGIGKIAHDTFHDTLKWDVFADPMRGVDPDPSEVPASRRSKDACEDTKPTPPKKTKKEKKLEKMKKDAAAAKDPSRVPLKWKATNNKDEEEPDGITARRIAALLEEHKDGPFFIAAGFHKPHLSHTAPRKYFDMYPADQVPAPVEPAGHTAGIPHIAIPPVYYPNLTDAQNRAMIAHYYAASTFMDAQVGVVLDAMDRLKLWDNTVVIFIGDHGWHLGEHGGFWAKMSIMEESARAPMIVVAPGSKPGQRCPRLVEFVDIYPTLCELSGVAAPAGLEGASFTRLLADPQQPWKKAAFSVVSRTGGREDAPLGRSVRTERFTYNLWPDGSQQLYDHDSDPREYRNLALDEHYASTVAEMKQALSAGWKAALP